ncbi:hypothetical protein HOU03_gp259 [Caulobacter phage CcrSC]|uniref:Uncharacterized protein n=1 Tax=Caulobacter phage CcrSC TaxID=2283272 RepID=A0A385EGT0_9CAUD|nr:hypothetical protein HOU03_gp259 [Caulobacter phage CcrSC]AXQ70009.1 hypothetical protein CcrSC_gp427 [Caulobacter phage CcrSC]
MCSRRNEYLPTIWERVTNTRWLYHFDERYLGIPLHRTFGGAMPCRVRAKDMSTSIGNRTRLMVRATGEVNPNRLPTHRVFGGYVPAKIRARHHVWTISCPSTGARL